MSCPPSNPKQRRAVKRKCVKKKEIDVGNPRGGWGLILESPWGSGVDFGIPVGVEGVSKNPKDMLNVNAREETEEHCVRHVRRCDRTV